MDRARWMRGRRGWKEKSPRLPFSLMNVDRNDDEGGNDKRGTDVLLANRFLNLRLARVSEILSPW